MLTNTPTPYRIPFLNVLSDVLQERGAGLRVLFCAMREPHRRWNLQLDEQRYPWKILPGWHPSVSSWHPHFNPTIVTQLREIRPAWILMGGAWNLPTTLLASQRYIAGDAYRIFWSEGHSRAVLHPRGLIAAARRCALRTYDAFAVPNGASARFIRAEAGDSRPVMFLPNTIDDDFFKTPSRADRQAARADLGIPWSKSVMVSICQLEDRKGVLELVAGFERLPREMRKDAMLVLIGTGSLRAALDAKASELNCGEVHLAGHLDMVDIRRWLRAADVFVLNSKRDPNPISVIEAAFSGLPLIVSCQAGNVEDLLRDELNGFLLEHHSADHVALALQRFLASDGETRRQMGARSAETAHQGFQRRWVAENFANALMTLERA